MHVRPKGVVETKYEFMYGDISLNKTDTYRYLGFNVHCHGDNLVGAEILHKSGERALGAVIAKVKKVGDVGVNTFMTLISMCVNPVLDYCGGLWGIDKKQQTKLDSFDRSSQ